jgi:hypothetical protein
MPSTPRNWSQLATPTDQLLAYGGFSKRRGPHVWNRPGRIPRDPWEETTVRAPLGSSPHIARDPAEEATIRTAPLFPVDPAEEKTVVAPPLKVGGLVRHGHVVAVAIALLAGAAYGVRATHAAPTTVVHGR